MLFCQLRLKQDASIAVDSKAEVGIYTEEIKALKALLMDFIGLSEKAKNQIVESDVGRGPIKASMDVSLSKVIKRTRRPSGVSKK